jgi:hypothetical protein
MMARKDYPAFTDFDRVHAMLADPATVITFRDLEYASTVRSCMIARRDHTTAREAAEMGGGFVTFTFFMTAERIS